MAKVQKQSERGANILNSPEERKKFKSALSTITHYFQQIDDAKESVKETVADIADQYGVDKKHVRKLAATMFKHNYESLQEENKHFEALYEIVIEGKLRGDGDPLAAALLADEPDDDASNDNKDLSE
jgi:Asp-tRNA(Asn)/Glu-tRNA(Gln) amidotransferase C subunit